MAALASLLAASALAAPPRIAPSARRLILVRHGAVDRARAVPSIKPGGFYGGNVDVPLSREGEAEALAAAESIAADHLTEVRLIWSSPMRRALFGARAVGTALAVAQSRGAEWTPPLEVATFEAFREVDRGPIGEGWTDLTKEEIEARDGPGALERFALEKVAGAFKAINGGEGFCDIRERVLKQRDAMLQEIPLGSAGVIVSHMWVTRAIVGEAIGEENPLNVEIPTASISVIDYPEGFSASAFAAGACPSPTVISVGFKPMVSKR
ncbi:hypothetical protein AB1Y20_004541 [Prymnesium parvum]|uniref:Phosphoglycerate mutase n=1 Tax=Prymnesium parvum TaxID=97485 RepID=A0AB34IZ21_PRYPA